MSQTSRKTKRIATAHDAQVEAWIQAGKVCGRCGRPMAPLAECPCLHENEPGTEVEEDMARDAMTVEIDSAVRWGTL